MTERPENTAGYKRWHVIRSVVLGAPAAKVWNVIGGFYTIHEWHPDISKTEVPSQQTQTRQLRRILTFPGQPKTMEELVPTARDSLQRRRLQNGSKSLSGGDHGDVYKRQVECHRRLLHNP